MRKIFYIIFLLITLTQVSTFAQVDPQPRWPIFDYLTIEPGTGYPTLYWTPPVHHDGYADPTGFIIYKEFFDAADQPYFDSIAYVNNTTFNFTDSSSDGNIDLLGYQVASYYFDADTFTRSQLTSTHRQIFTTSSFDSCYTEDNKPKPRIDLKWLAYTGWGNRIDYYDVYVGNNTNWVSFVKDTTLKGTDTKYSITGVRENTDYYFYLVAKKVDATFMTYSNLHHLFTKMASHPQYMAIDTISAENQKVNINFRIDPLTELKDFRVVRWGNLDNFENKDTCLFSAQELKLFSNTETSPYADTSDSWATRTRSFYYKIDAYNGCPNLVNVSNLCNIIIPTVRLKDNLLISIEWNDMYFDVTHRPNNSGNSIEYRLYRYAYTESDVTSNTFEKTLVTTTRELSFEDDVTGYRGQDPPYTITFNYQVEAIEREPMGRIVTMSRSRLIPIDILPGVTMPTAIDPSDTREQNGHPRNIFVPVINFAANYTLTVYSRWGEAIFQGENQGWNGKLKSGNFAKEGAYTYRLVVHAAGSKAVIRTGNFVVVYTSGR